MTELQRALIYGSMIGSILMEYEEPRPEPVEIIVKRINGMMEKYSAGKYRKQYIEAVELANRVWAEAIDYFIDKNVAIEAVRTVSALWSESEKELFLYATLWEHNFNNLEEYQSGKSDICIETNSFNVSGYIIEALNRELGIVTDNRLSVMKRSIETKINLKRLEKEAGL